MASVSLHIIARDEKAHLIRIVEKYEKYFDGIDIAIDSQEIFDFLTKYWEFNKKIHLYKYEWINDFSHKHNFLAGKCTSDYYFRIDTDDEILNPEAIKQTLDICEKDNISIVYCYYIYSKDEWGNTNAAHYRETIIKKTPNLVWNKPIHENIIPLSRANFNMLIDEEIKINHLIDYEHSVASALRNIEYLIKEYNRDKDKTDPRTIAYLGRTFAGLGHYDKARKFLEQHISLSGWDEDRFQSWCQLSDIHRLNEDYPLAIASAFEALQERPDYPDGYLKLHDAYFDQGQWKKAIEWGEMGLQKKIPKTFTLLNPAQYTWMPLISMALSYLEMGEVEKAWKFFNGAKTFVPTLSWIIDHEKVFKDGLDRANYVRHLAGMVGFLKDKDEEKLPKLIESIPKELEDHQIIVKLRNSFCPPKVYGDKSIVIFCGTTPENWYPQKIETGIGGSEEAVIQLAKQFVKLGYEVDVYNNCGEFEGTHDGVNYISFHKFNPKALYNILISWRANSFAFGVRARQRIVWLHDFPAISEFIGEAANSFDKVVVLSQYHKSLLNGEVPEDKIYISTNGIVPEDFIELKEERNPHRTIYASSYNRGLEEMLKMWADVKKEVPEAEFHIYYGWDVYDKYVATGFLKDQGFKERMVKLMQQDGVFEHGRVGHKELLKEYAKSGVYAYYCTYKGEINCIALSKAFACGCKVVTNKRFVMGERNSSAVDDDKFKDTWIEALKSPPLDAEFVSYQFSWEDIAKEWDKDLFIQPVETEEIEKNDWLRRYFSERNGEKIIDIGANNGHAFEKWDRKNITSVDIDKYEYEGFVQANAEALPFEDNVFDKALFTETLEHVENPVKALSEARRVAKMVVITVPYEHEWEKENPFNTPEKESSLKKQTIEQLAKEGNRAKEFYPDGYRHLWHRTFYTPRLLQEHLDKAGYTDYKITKMRWEGQSWLGVVGR